ncbi:hypothetical protein [Pantoea stewartii]|uniref:Uncharacterized protein n=1 Tax=Pantoea stewartii subsp. stewartii DC283 TaxID=660596 RepID=H3RLL6_PANSE|nr:hypothetical protein [Pantoea stewartii]ARF52773.1 hypothetical protein DSJ_26560 [Pantoea stewartii subsp. stewartii DC283]EHT97729.1 hypothetical protein CKS_5591 [Pantoea stewartii subsp. stewartii DC283]KAB0553994.1 hypothetical protein F7Q90_12440 [Pantoea stewartii subsp. stewartii]
MKEQRAASVTLQLVAYGDDGKPLGGINKVVGINAMRDAGFPLLMETAAGAASELEEVINAHYGIVPRG